MPNLNTKLSALIISTAGAALMSNAAIAQATPDETPDAELLTEESAPSEATLEKATHVESFETDTSETSAAQMDPDMDADVDVMAPTPSTADYFTAADVDGDAALNSDEFRVFVDTLADSGNEAYIVVRDGVTYDEAFAAADADADGLVTYLEVSGE